MKQTLHLTVAKLPQHLHEILIGYMLGDGGIFYATKKSASPRFEFSMGKDKLEFAQHLASLFKDYASNPLKVVQVSAVAKGTLLSFFRFKTKSLSVFSYYKNIFYKVNSATGRAVKIVPPNIADMLTVASLAYLIMSDGNFDAGRNRVRIYTNSFSKADVELLAKAIKSNFDLYVAVIADTSRSEANQYIITIGAKELEKLRTLLVQHMHPSMKHRIGV